MSYLHKVGNRDANNKTSCSWVLPSNRIGSGINSAWSAWDSMVLVGREETGKVSEIQCNTVTLQVSLAPTAHYWTDWRPQIHSTTIILLIAYPTSQTSHTFASIAIKPSVAFHIFPFTITLGTSSEDFPIAAVQVAGWDPEVPCADWDLYSQPFSSCQRPCTTQLLGVLSVCSRHPME